MIPWKNKLYFGDNLAVMREHIPDAGVDLVYLDPPFNSKATYNVLFKEKNGTESAAQITAFDDTWHWDAAAAETYHDLVTRGPKKLADLVLSLHSFLGANDMMAYLVMMAVRLVEMRRVLKDTGSIYLHCDPTASHYLKLVMDAVFGRENFRTEIIWKRSSAHSDAKQGRKQHGRIHDVIFFYTKSDEWLWNPVYTPYDLEYVDTFYKFSEPGTGRLYRMGDLTAARPGGDTLYEWRVKRRENFEEWESDLQEEWKKPKKGWEYRGILPYNGRYWAYSRANMTEYAHSGRLCYTGTGMPCYKRYLDEMPGVPLQDLWSDIPPALGAQDLGYPTQKPEALLERIIRASSNEGDLVLDPFCGCGTTVNVAERLHRRWLGIDITHLAITLIKHRLEDTFGQELAPYEILGDPKDIESARALAAENRHQFEWWALSLVDARPAQDKRKGADRGVDGFIYFFDDESGKARKIVVQVKSGHVNAAQIRDLKGTIEREKAVIGVFITLEEPTAPMRAEAADAGFYEFRHIISGNVLKFPRVQIFTVEELLAGAMVKMPAHAVEDTIRKAKRKKKEKQWGGEILLL